MCYACTRCNECGKFNEGSVMYVPPADIPCMSCGCEAVDLETGLCPECGALAFEPPGTRGAKGAGMTGSAKI